MRLWIQLVGPKSDCSLGHLATPAMRRTKKSTSATANPWLGAARVISG